MDNTELKLFLEQDFKSHKKQNIHEIIKWLRFHEKKQYGLGLKILDSMVEQGQLPLSIKIKLHNIVKYHDEEYEIT